MILSYAGPEYLAKMPPCTERAVRTQRFALLRTHENTRISFET